MNSFAAKAAFRVRERAVHFLGRVPRRLYWRCLGMRLGARTYLPKVHVTWPHQVSIGADCAVEQDAFFKFDGTYRPGPSLVFGDKVFIGAGCEFNIRAGLSVGSNCLIASGCHFVDHDHGFASRTVPIGAQVDGAEAAITLEDDVWLGAGVVVLKGVHIGRGAIVGAGSVLNRSVGPFEIWAGAPARKIADRP